MHVLPFRSGLFWVLLVLGQWPLAVHSGPTNTPVTANILTIAWNPSPSPSVAGYTLYWGVGSAPGTNRLVLGNVSETTLVLGRLDTNAIYFFAVVARDEVGDESEPSNFVQYSLSPIRFLPRLRKPFVRNYVPPEPPRVPFLEFQGLAGDIYDVLATTNLLDWEVALTTNCVNDGKVSIEMPYSPDFPQRFFRLHRQ